LIVAAVPQLGDGAGEICHLFLYRSVVCSLALAGLGVNGFSPGDFPPSITNLSGLKRSVSFRWWFMLTFICVLNPIMLFFINIYNSIAFRGKVSNRMKIKPMGLNKAKLFTECKLILPTSSYSSLLAGSW